MTIIESLVLKFIKESTGITVHIDQDNKLRFDIVVIGKFGNNLKVLKHSTCNCFEDLTNELPKDNPIFVAVDGYGIINKQLDSENNDIEIASILPNVKISDLYIQRIDQENNGKTFISVVRKDKINELITLLNKVGIYPYNIILGPFSVLNLFSMIKEEKEIAIPGYRFTLNDNSTVSFNKESISNSINIDFGDFNVSSDYIVPLASSIAFFSSAVSINNNIASIEIQRKEYLSRKLFRVCSVLILLTIFISLAINILLLSSYRSENQKLNNTINFNKELVLKTDSIKKVIKEKKILSELFNDKESHMYSYYADRIASVIPTYVALTNISINPAFKSNKSRNVNNFKKGFISVKGQITGTGALDLMIKSLISFSWIENVEIRNYTDTENDPAIFEIDIKIR